MFGWENHLHVMGAWYLVKYDTAEGVWLVSTGIHALAALAENVHVFRNFGDLIQNLAGIRDFDW